MSLALGLLVVRLALGLAFASHGAQKLLGWFGGQGLVAAGGLFDAIGFRPGRFFVTVAAVGELLGGLLIASGFLGGVGPMLVVSTMTVAIVAVHGRNGFYQANNGYELAFTYAVAAAALAFAGYGPWSLDHAFGIVVTSRPAVVLLLLGLGILGGLGAVAGRRLPPKPVAAAS